ncbi:hypothetical protein BGZ46_006045 [Entomortierella lignicola]|nr:hypothetical protein BGZ46_006045 [Entomortierella lignicola]
MDELVLHLHNEVALDGSSWSRFWYLVDQFLHTRDTKAGVEGSSTNEQIKRTDEKFRLYFWNNFVREEGAFLYIHNSASENPPGEAPNDARASFVPFSELVMLEQQEITYLEVMEKHKDTIRIVATPEHQRITVLGYSGAASQVTAQVLQVLQCITATREIGATQAQLAKQHKIDPRSMYHFLKVLLEMKLIVKIPVTTDGQYTLLCIHTKFAGLNEGFKAMNSEESFSGASRPLVTGDGGRRFEGLLKSDNKKVSYYSGVIKQKLTQILGRAKSQAMSIDDIAKALDLVDMNVVQNRWFNRQIELLCKLKYIKRVQVPGIHRCVQLVRLYGVDMTVEEGEDSQLNLKSVIADDTPQSGITIDTSIEHQVYNHILDSKEKGTIAKEIRRKMNMLNVKLLARILDTLSKPSSASDKPLVQRVVEFVGRERRYRYYSDQGFKSSVAEDHKEYIEKAKSMPVTATPPRSRKKQSKSKINDTQATQPVDSSLKQGSGTIDTPGSSSGSANATGESEASSLPGTGADSNSEARSTNKPELVTPTASPSNESTLVLRPATDLTQFTNPERFISVGLLKRRKIVLSLLERRKMVELHQSLVNEYQQEKARLYPNQDENSVIDRKTLYRTINILETEGLLKTYKVDNIPLVGEGTTTKTFCIHPSIDPDSEEAKKFVRECGNRHLLFGSLGLKPQRQVERVNLEVESLDEMQQRLGQEFNKGRLVPLSDVGAMEPKSKTDPKPSKPNKPGPDFEGLDYATEFGWNRAKMMRALVFHRFLLDKLSSKDKTLFPYPNTPNMLSTTPLFEVMHLRVFLFVVGITSTPSEEIRSYLLVHRDSSIQVDSLPEFMRPYVAPNQNFKKRLREVLEILDALGLVTPMSAPAYGGVEPFVKATNHLVLNTHYDIHVNVKAPLDPQVPDNLEHNLEERKTYMLLAPKECRDFWMDLQSSASVMKYVQTGRSAARPWDEIRKDFLLNLCNKRIWAEPIRITSSQSAKLMTQVNTKIRFVPPPHDPIMDEMAKETGLPRDHVVQFYKAITKVWHANPMPPTTVRLRQVKKSRQAAIDKQERSIAPITRAASSSATSPHKGLIDNQGPTITSVQDRGGRFSVGLPKKSRARRVVWTDAEDERLLLSYAITRCISDTFNYKFSWTCVAGAFEGERSREVCRHRFGKLSREITLTKRADSYRAQFSHALPEISEKFGIQRKLDDFDINPIMSYFKPSAESKLATSVYSSPLPMDPSELEQYNQVRQNERYACLYVEERLHTELSLPRRLLLINQLPSTLRTDCAQELDLSPEDVCGPRIVTSEIPECIIDKDEKLPLCSFTVRNEVLSTEHTILAVVKAIYSLPRQKRPRSVIRAILSCFQSSKVLETCELAKECKILTSIKNASFRIPGQRVGRSEKFSIMMNGALPRRLTAAAAEIDELYHMATERRFQLDVGPAEMMIFLTDIAMGWLELSMVKPIGEGTATAFEEPYGQGAILHFDVSMKNTRTLVQPNAQPPSARIKGFITHDDQDMDKTEKPKAEGQLPTKNSTMDPWQKARDMAQLDFIKLVDTELAEEQRRLYKYVYAIILGSSSTGVLLQDIKDSLLERRLAFEDKELRDCILKLQAGNPPILVRVGMAQARFIVFGWHNQWTVNYHDAHESSELDPMHWVVPRMWKTLAGDVDKAIFETCLHAVLSHIAEKPGISKGALLKYFYKMFMVVELDDLIAELEGRNAIEARYGILPPPAGLFSKRTMYIECDRYTIHERKVTNYFAQPAYYTYLDMSLVVSDGITADVEAPVVDDDDDKDVGEEEEVEVAEGTEGPMDRLLSGQAKAKKARIDK